MGNKINLKTGDGWESNFLSGIDNTLQLSPCKNKYISDLSSGRYRGSKFQNLPFYLHFLTDTTSVLSILFSFHMLSSYYSVDESISFSMSDGKVTVKICT